MTSEESEVSGKLRKNGEAGEGAKALLAEPASLSPEFFHMQVSVYSVDLSVGTVLVTQCSRSNRGRSIS